MQIFSNQEKRDLVTTAPLIISTSVEATMQVAIQNSISPAAGTIPFHATFNSLDPSYN